MNAPLRPRRDREGTLVQLVETLLDKGLVLNADILVSMAGVELVVIRLRAGQHDALRRRKTSSGGAPRDAECRPLSPSPQASTNSGGW